MHKAVAVGGGGGGGGGVLRVLKNPPDKERSMHQKVTTNVQKGSLLQSA